MKEPPRLITPEQRAERKAGKPWTGLGDVIASATRLVGIKPCAGCKKRQAALNAAVPFSTQNDHANRH